MNLPDNPKSNANGTMRLQVYLAHAGIASRRTSEKLIAEGRVSVNGTVVTEPGTKVCATDTVLFDGTPVKPEETKRYIALNKPLGYVCSLSDERNRPVAAELLKEHFPERLYNVGRLDMFSSGLIFFTNDGDFAARLSHPSAEIEKEYLVESSTSLPRTLGEEFQKGLRVDGIFYKCKRAEEVNSHKIRIVLVEGKNREIRNVFASKEIGIRTLIRVRIGNIELGELRPGEFRELSTTEVKSLLGLCKSGSKINYDGEKL